MIRDDAEDDARTDGSGFIREDVVGGTCTT
jgi:hypothetical protein